MKKLIRNGLLGFIGCLCSLVAVAQQPSVSLSLAEALQQAKANSWEMKVKEAEIQAARAEFRQTDALYLPQVEFSSTAVRTNNPLQSFGIKLLQETVEQADFNPASLNDPAGITNFNQKIEVRQPLLNLDAYHGRKAADAKLKATQLGATRTGEFIELEIKKAYFGLKLAYESEAVLNKALQAANANLKLTQDNLAQGYVKEADVMAVELRIMELQNQLAELKNNKINASEYLGYFLQIEPGTLINPTDELNLTDNLTTLNQETVSESRSDMQAMQFGLQTRKEMLQHEKSKFLPRINAFGAYEFNDKSFLGTQGENYLIGAQLSWKIFNGGQQFAGVKKAQAELAQTELGYKQMSSKANMELRQAQRAALLAREKLAISEKAVAHTKETYRIRNNRYEQGMERTSDVLVAEAEVAGKELEHLKNLYDFNVALFQLEFLAGN